VDVVDPKLFAHEIVVVLRVGDGRLEQFAPGLGRVAGGEGEDGASLLDVLATDVIAHEPRLAGGRAHVLGLGGDLQPDRDGLGLLFLAAAAATATDATLLLLLGGLLGLSAALTLGLVPVLGARGAAVATVAGESTLALTYAITLFAGSDLKVKLGFVLKVAFAAGVALLLLLVPGLRSLPLAVAACGVYLLVLLVVRGIPRELGEQLLGMEPLAGEDELSGSS
jgi:hypothetical protein